MSKPSRLGADIDFSGDPGQADSYVMDVGRGRVPATRHTSSSSRRAAAGNSTVFSKCTCSCRSRSNSASAV